MVPSLFANAAVYKESAAENSYLSTMRLHIRGTKRILAVRLIDVLEYLRSVYSVESPKPGDAFKWLKELTAANVVDFQAYAREHLKCSDAVYHLEVRPSQMSYLPAGWAYVEEVSKSSDCVGIRIQYLSVDERATLEKLSRHLVSIKRENRNLTDVVNKLVMDA